MRFAAGVAPPSLIVLVPVHDLIEVEALGLERKACDVTVDGVDVEVFSPMRARWASEAAEAAKQAIE